MRKIITYGTFDTLHFGHIRLLKRARDLGDFLIVAVSTDEFNAIKGKKSHFSYAQRVADLAAVKWIDKIIPENGWDQKREDIKKYGCDTFVIGDDWMGKFDNLSDICKVTYLQRTEGISSTIIKGALGPSDLVEAMA